jgi:N-acylethanolamine-hydrolysing acid amidase
VWPLSSSSGAWYRLQTNYDHWKPAPPRDDRRTPGNEHMQDVGPDAFDEETLWGVLATVPTLNNATKYTSIMSASESAFINTSSWIVV